MSSTHTVAPNNKPQSQAHVRPIPKSAPKTQPASSSKLNPKSKHSGSGSTSRSTSLKQRGAGRHSSSSRATAPAKSGGSSRNHSPAPPTHVIHPQNNTISSSQRQRLRRHISHKYCNLRPEKDGLRAMIVCVAAMLAYGVVWGTNGSFGVLYVSLYEELVNSNGQTLAATKTSLIGSLNTGFSYLSCVFSGMAIDYIGIRLVTLIGVTLACLGCALAIPAIYLPYPASLIVWLITFGFITGVGNGFIFVATVAIIPEYFSKRFGFANAAVSLGSSFAYMTYPIIWQTILQSKTGDKENKWPVLLTMLFILFNYLVLFVCVWLFVPIKYAGNLCSGWFNWSTWFGSIKYKQTLQLNKRGPAPQKPPGASCLRNTSTSKDTKASDQEHNNLESTNKQLGQGLDSSSAKGTTIFSHNPEMIPASVDVHNGEHDQAQATDSLLAKKSMAHSQQEESTLVQTSLSADTAPLESKGSSSNDAETAPPLENSDGKINDLTSDSPDATVAVHVKGRFTQLKDSPTLSSKNHAILDSNKIETQNECHKGRDQKEIAVQIENAPSQANETQIDSSVTPETIPIRSDTDGDNIELSPEVHVTSREGQGSAEDGHGKVDASPEGSPTHSPNLSPEITRRTNTGSTNGCFGCCRAIRSTITNRWQGTLSKLTAKSKSPTWNAIGRIGSNRNFIVFLLSSILYFFGTGIPDTHTVKFMDDHFANSREGLPLNMSASALVVFGTFQGVGKLISGYVADCATTLFARMWLYQFGPLVKGMIITLFPIVANHLPSVPVFLALNALLGLTDSTQYALFPFMTMAIVGLDDLNLAAGVIMAITGLTLMISAPFGGFFYDMLENYYLAYMICGTVMLVGACFLFLMNFEDKKRAEIDSQIKLEGEQRDDEDADSSDDEVSSSDTDSDTDEVDFGHDQEVKPEGRKRLNSDDDLSSQSVHSANLNLSKAGIEEDSVSGRLGSPGLGADKEIGLHRVERRQSFERKRTGSGAGKNVLKLPNGGSADANSTHPHFLGNIASPPIHGPCLKDSSNAGTPAGTMKRNSHISFNVLDGSGVTMKLEHDSELEEITALSKPLKEQMTNELQEPAHIVRPGTPHIARGVQGNRSESEESAESETESEERQSKDLLHEIVIQSKRNSLPVSPVIVNKRVRNPSVPPKSASTVTDPAPSSGASLYPTTVAIPFLSADNVPLPVLSQKMRNPDPSGSSNNDDPELFPPVNMKLSLPLTHRVHIGSEQTISERRRHYSHSPSQQIRVIPILKSASKSGHGSTMSTTFSGPNVPNRSHPQLSANPPGHAHREHSSSASLSANLTKLHPPQKSVIALSGAFALVNYSNSTGAGGPNPTTQKSKSRPRSKSSSSNSNSALSSKPSKSSSSGPGAKP